MGTALIVDGVVEPMELGHLPYLKHTYEYYVSNHALEHKGKKKWRKHVLDVIKRLSDALQPDEVVIGGGNVSHLKKLPHHCRAGDNDDAFLGGFRLWEEEKSGRSSGGTPRKPRRRQPRKK